MPTAFVGEASHEFSYYPPAYTSVNFTPSLAVLLKPPRFFVQDT